MLLGRLEVLIPQFAPLSSPKNNVRSTASLLRQCLPAELRFRRAIICTILNVGPIFMAFGSLRKTTLPRSITFTSMRAILVARTGSLAHPQLLPTLPTSPTFTTADRTKDIVNVDAVRILRKVEMVTNLVPREKTGSSWRAPVRSTTRCRRDNGRRVQPSIRLELTQY